VWARAAALRLGLLGRLVRTGHCRRADRAGGLLFGPTTPGTPTAQALGRGLQRGGESPSKPKRNRKTSRWKCGNDRPRYDPLKPSPARLGDPVLRVWGHGDRPAWWPNRPSPVEIEADGHPGAALEGSALGLGHPGGPRSSPRRSGGRPSCPPARRSPHQALHAFADLDEGCGIGFFLWRLERPVAGPGGSTSRV